MATTPTNKPIPSEDPRDLKFNAGKIDEVVTSKNHYYTDRFGVRRFTIAGFQYTAEEAIRNYGYITIDSFEDGATLTLPNQVLRYEATGEYYRWDGELPKSVPAGSTPETSGGVGLGKWLSVGDATARQWAESYFMTLEYKKIYGDTFSTGGSATANESALLNPLDNMYYSPISGTITVPPNSSPDDDWVCVGYLSAYSIDDPRNYGAVPDDPTFDSSAALDLWRDSVLTRKRQTSFPSSKDDPTMLNLGGAILDMSQGVYYTTKPLDFVDTFNFTLLNPTITALDGFTAGRAILEFKLGTGTRPLDGIRIENPVLDGNWKADGCILAYDFWKMPIIGGVLSRYREYGVKTDYVSYPPHELNMALTHIGQQPVWEADIPADVVNGVALDINNYDNNYTGLIISQQVKDVAYLRKGAGSFVNCHFYPHQETDPTKGKISIMSNADQFVGCYFDGCQVESSADGARYTISACNWLVANHGIALNMVSNPFQVKVTDCRFRNTTGVTMSASVIRMKTISEGRTSRPDIRNNVTENCAAISTSGREFFTLTSTDAARVVTRDIPDQFRPASSVGIQETSGNTNDDTWLLKARLISTGQVRMRPYNMTNLASTATYTGPVVLMYNTEND